MKFKSASLISKKHVSGLIEWIDFIEIWDLFRTIHVIDLIIVKVVEFLNTHYISAKVADILSGYKYNFGFVSQSG